MKTTRLLKINRRNQEEMISRAAGIIKQGGTVAFPTETVYGLGADALNPVAVEQIFKAKGRPADNPLIVHISSRTQLHDIVRDIPQKAVELMDTFWPGPLTLILRRKDTVPHVTTCGLDTVAVRMPDDHIALQLITAASTPIAAPSANISGRPSPTTAQHVMSDLGGRIDAVINGGPVQIGVESTVLDLTSDMPVLLRPGGIGVAEIQKIVGEVVMGYNEVGQRVRSPGLKYTHYSPETKLLLVKGEGSAVVDTIAELVADFSDRGLRVGLLVTSETAQAVQAGEMFILGSRDNLPQIAASLFAGLRYLDRQNLDVIIADGFIKPTGVGLAVINRLKKAAHELIEPGSR